MEKFVNIKAFCPYFEIQETVPEKNAAKRLKTIRKMFEYQDKKWGKGQLKVNTVIANPELFS